MHVGIHRPSLLSCFSLALLALAACWFLVLLASGFSVSCSPVLLSLSLLVCSVASLLSLSLSMSLALALSIYIYISRSLCLSRLFWLSLPLSYFAVCHVGPLFLDIVLALQLRHFALNICYDVFSCLGALVSTASCAIMSEHCFLCKCKPG